MLLWVGLGNPGAKYAGNRHNVGFMAIDAVAGYYHFDSEKSRFNSLVRDGVIDFNGQAQRVLALKPQTFMNDSGPAVQKFMQFYKIPPGRLTVFYDEIDLIPGKVRHKSGGGIAGHNGLRSIRQHVGEGFHRIRIGIGHPGHKEKVPGHVLSDFAKSEQVWVNDVLNALARSADLLAAGEADKYQTRVNLMAPPPGKTRRNDR
ncbi:MAG: aminoacyl-tRNA hydrolase [Hyphomonadaceae bacterium]|nr:aminoacyl-tRNA hydrolase [Hyphomonadaceae bacterium]MBC6412298.1 aminoacyl-tRNA hydrolase [Hyphomonadaceae bacterium]